MGTRMALAPALTWVNAVANGFCLRLTEVERATLRENPKSRILDTAATITDIVVRQHPKHIGHLMRCVVSA
jgi:hypothetical protein